MQAELITKTMKIEEVILGFPQNGLRLRRMMRNVLSCSEELPNESIEALLFRAGKQEDEVDLFVQKMNMLLQEHGASDCISLTKRAAIKLNQLLFKNERMEGGIRIADQVASCGTGFEYVLELSDDSHADEITFYSHDIPIYSPRKTIKRFLGTLIDFEEEVAPDQHFTGLMQLGFSIFNPNVQTTCPCGCSVNYKEIG
jgi:iron-sulfur cluster assembly accessory protein